MKSPNRAQLNAWLLPLATLFVAVSLSTNDITGWDLYIRWAALSMLVVLVIVNYVWNLLYHMVLRHHKGPKAACPYYSAEQCPHGDRSECHYDTSICHIHKPNMRKYLKHLGIIFLLLLSASVTILAELVIENQGFLSFMEQNYDVKTMLRVLQPISNSLIAAIVVYFLIDIPGRLKEYQLFFC